MTAKGKDSDDAKERWVLAIAARKDTPVQRAAELGSFCKANSSTTAAATCCFRLYSWYFLARVNCACPEGAQSHRAAAAASGRRVMAAAATVAAPGGEVVQAVGCYIVVSQPTMRLPQIDPSPRTTGRALAFMGQRGSRRKATLAA